MNLLDDVMRRLGIEYDEEFEIIGQSGRFKITKMGFVFSSSNFINTCNYVSDSTFYKLTTGYLKIKPKKWKPKFGDEFYVTDLLSRTKYMKYTWCDSKTDNYIFESNLVFRTSQEAVDNGDKILELLKGWS